MIRAGQLRHRGFVGDRAPFAKQLLDPANGIALVRKQLMDSPGKRDIGRPVITAVSSPLQGFQRKLALPVAQDVLGYPELLRQFADGPEGVRRLGRGNSGRNQSSRATRSRIVWLARKVITRRGAIGTSMPVLGLRPIR